MLFSERGFFVPRGSDGYIDRRLCWCEKPRNSEPNQSGSIDSALAAFDNEIENNPGNALAHVWRGLMLISLERPAEAIPSIERGIALSPRDWDLNIFYRNMAHAYFSVGRFDQAVTWGEKAIAHSPRYAKGYVFLAAAASLKGDQAQNERPET